MSEIQTGFFDDDEARSNPEPNETDAEREDRIRARFALFDDVLRLVGQERIDSAIVYGAPGIGKSYVVERRLPHAVIIRGAVSAVGLYETLFLNRHDTIVFDDCDTLLWDLQSLNLLKAVLDTTGTRTVRWGKQNRVLEDKGIDSEFDFGGQVLVLTNVDFRAESNAQSKSAPHLRALLDRAYFIQLSTADPRDVLARARLLAREGDWLSRQDEVMEVIDFVASEVDMWHFVSLRLIAQLIGLRNGTENWRDLARMLKARDYAGGEGFDPNELAELGALYGPWLDND